MDGGDTCSREEVLMLIKPNIEDKKMVENIVTPPPTLRKIKETVIIKFSDDDAQNLIHIKDTRLLKKKILAEQLVKIKAIGRAVAKQKAEQHKRNLYLWAKF